MKNTFCYFAAMVFLLAAGLLVAQPVWAEDSDPNTPTRVWFAENAPTSGAARQGVPVGETSRVRNRDMQRAQDRECLKGSSDTAGQTRAQGAGHEARNGQGGGYGGSRQGR